MRIKSPLIAGVGLLLANAATAAPLCEGAPSDTSIHIVVENVRSDAGLMAATLYGDDETHFLKSQGSLKVWRVPAHAPTTAMCIWLPHPGPYEVAVYHDANSNLKWDHAALGSIEGFGFSRNPTIFFSPPSLKATRFQAPVGDTTLHIRLELPLDGERNPDGRPEGRRARTRIDTHADARPPGGHPVLQSRLRLLQ